MSKVVYARLQTGAYVVGTGDLGAVFPPQGKTLEGLDMRATDRGLTMKFKYRGLAKSLLVPYGNVVIMETVEEEPEVKAAKSTKS